MYTLYGSRGTGSACPQAVLEYVGAQYEMIMLDTSKGEHKKPEYLAMNPRGQVPWLVTSEGVVTESSAIALHIADAHPDAGLIGPLGSQQRASTYRWMAFLATNIYESVLRVEYTDRYTTDENTAGVKEAAERDIARWWDLVEGSLQDTTLLTGKKLSVPDIYMAMLVAWSHDKKKLLEGHPRLAKAVTKVTANPAVHKVFEANGLI